MAERSSGRDRPLPRQVDARVAMKKKQMQKWTTGMSLAGASARARADGRQRSRSLLAL